MFITIEKKQVSVACFSGVFYHKSIYISKAWVICHIQMSVQCGNFFSFATRVHQKYEYERITKSIKSSLMDVYDRFPSQFLRY